MMEVSLFFKYLKIDYFYSRFSFKATYAFMQLEKQKEKTLSRIRNMENIVNQTNTLYGGLLILIV